MGIRVFGHVSSEKMRENGPKVHKKKIRFDIRIFFFTEKAVKHCNKLPRVMVEYLSLEMFKWHLDLAPGDMFEVIKRYGDYGSARLTAGQVDHEADQP